MKKWRINHKHLHPHNSSKRQRMGSKYATIAFVRTSGGVVLGTGLARCNTHDAIDKHYGATLARERALENALLCLLGDMPDV